MAEPKCPYYGRCGGCSRQHVDYDSQLESKKRSLASAISYKLMSQDHPIDIKVFSGKEYCYRDRMDFVFYPGGLGFREKDKWFSIVDIKSCPIANQQVNELLAEIRAFFREPDAFDVMSHKGTLRYAVVRATPESSSVSFVLNEDSDGRSDCIARVKEFAAISKADSVMIASVAANTDQSLSSDFFVVKGSSELADSYLGKVFCFSAQGFFQNNHEMAEKMHAYVHNVLKKYDLNSFHLLDIYAGVGSFGIMNSALFKSVIIVESIKECIDCAEKNIAHNSVQNAEAVLMNARQIRKLELPERLFVITDPPRAGMHPEAIAHLNRIKPKVIIYVSCSIKQLARELPLFKEYSIKSSALFDFFPQTEHSEAVIELVLKNWKNN